MASSPVPIGEVFADKYRVDRVLGEGGMGIVVAAHHLELDQPVAIKFLLDDLATNQEGAERFRREARAAAKIQSDHVVRVLDVGVLPGGERYMVMEYMEGRDLSEELSERRAFPVGIAAGFIVQALDAVAHAHQVGIVHRDLKPANLFLVNRPDGSQRVKVLDFGISKSIGSATSEEMSLTKTSAWIGSPLYMAPEQMQSARDVDARADIWSLGAILYELVSGRPPYEAESLPQLCNMLITMDPEPIQNHCPAIPDGLAQAIMSCLVRNRDQRTQTARELSQALMKYATTSSGSRLAQSLMAQTEVAMGVPASVMAASYVDSTRLKGSQSDSGAISSSTKAAWGGTDAPRDQTSKGKWGLMALAAGAAGVIGFIMMSQGKAPEAEVLSPVVASPGAVDEKDTVDVPPVINAKAKDPVPNPASVVEEPLPAKVEPVAEPVAPTPAALPRPPAPRPPAPRPSSKPQPTDDLSDFGGRR